MRTAGSCDRVCRRPRRGRYDDMLWSDVPRRTAPSRIARMIAPPERRYDLLTLGETLMRLSPPANQRLDQPVDEAVVRQFFEQQAAKTRRLKVQVDRQHLLALARQMRSEEHTSELQSR